MLIENFIGGNDWSTLTLGLLFEGNILVGFYRSETITVHLKRHILHESSVGSDDSPLHSSQASVLAKTNRARSKLTAVIKRKKKKPRQRVGVAHASFRPC